MKSKISTVTLLAFMLGLSGPLAGCDQLGLGSTSDKSKAAKDSDDDEDKDKKKKKKKSDDEEDEDEDDDKKGKGKKSDKKDKEADKPKDEKTATADTAPPPVTAAPPPTPTPTPTAATPPPPTPAAGESFAGIYRTTYGDMRMRQEGTKVNGTYPGGTLTCDAVDKTLNCSWKDNFGTGKAKLSKFDNGDLKGTWGNGSSDSNGGSWLFTLLTAGDPGATGEEAQVGSFAGDYISTYGMVKLTEEGGRVKGTYPGGTLDCTPNGANLECDWRESGSIGKARLTRQGNGNVSGTWGNGGSATNGGSWLFRKK